MSDMKHAYYAAGIRSFLSEETDRILGRLTRESSFAVDPSQRDAWLTQIAVLKRELAVFDGWIFLEYSIPRMGKRVDAVATVGPAVFVLEFKVGERGFPSHAVDQVTDYALDLKNFHEESHGKVVVPILVSTGATGSDSTQTLSVHSDRLVASLRVGPSSLRTCISTVLERFGGETSIDGSAWYSSRYKPTPTIIEAATALYNGHAVAEISRSDAGGRNLERTTDAIETLISDAHAGSYKAICFVTGVPGAGKTLIGLNVATKHFDRGSDLYSVFLSGNGPLVKILQEALARDKVVRDHAAGKVTRKGVARSEVKTFVQNVHHYRDSCLRDQRPPVDHVALFDEAQRAWTLEQTTQFMRRKKGLPNFAQSEPEFLISCIDRHPDWGVIVCLVGGGQEINTGEAGIGEWIAALLRSFPDWHIHISDRLRDEEYGAGGVLRLLQDRSGVYYDAHLHLSTSMRSFRSEQVSQLVKQVLDLDRVGAESTLRNVAPRYPIALTRDVDTAKAWLRERARGSERYGIVVSSQANRLKPLAIDVRLKPNPVHWFLAGKDDVRSSFYLEDVATEFEIQGLELDWACVTWDADLRHTRSGWSCHSFRGTRWVRIRKKERQTYLKNAYRVLLTRARQGMIIVVPRGEASDPTRSPAFYDPTYKYFEELGLQIV